MSSATPGGDRFISDPGQLAAKILEWRARGYHVLSPATQVWAFAPGYGVNVSMVVLDPKVDPDGFGEDTYFDKATMDAPGDNLMAPGAERAINATGLRRISQCAGVVWHPDLTGRLDDRRILNLWEYRAFGLMQGYDGSWLPLQGTREIDLRDGSAQIGGWTKADWDALMEKNGTLPKDAKKKYDINGWSERRVLNQRCNGLSLAETKAMNRAIRTIGLSHRYTVAELGEPFVVLRVSFVPDSSDETTKQRILDRGFAGALALFATRQPQRALDAPAARVIDVETVAVPTRTPVLVPPVVPPAASTSPTSVGPVVHVTVTPIPESALPPANGALPATMPPVSTTPAPAAAAQPAIPSNAKYVTNCAVGKTGKNVNGDWTKWIVEFADGTKAHTFLRTVAEAAADAITQRAPVLIELEHSDQFGSKVTALSLVDTRQLTLPVDGAPPDLTKDGIKW